MLLTGNGCSDARTAPVSWHPLGYLALQLPSPSTAWGTGGSLPVAGGGVLAWAYSSAPVTTPSNPNSDFLEHTDCTFNFHLVLNLRTAKAPINSWLLRYHVCECARESSRLRQLGCWRYRRWEWHSYVGTPYLPYLPTNGFGTHELSVFRSETS